MKVTGPSLAVVRVLWPKGLNTSWYLDLNDVSRHSAWAHGFMHAYALWLGLVLVVIAFLAAYVVVWWRRDVRAAGLMFLGGAGTLIALGLNQVVGHAAQELRPYDTLRHVLVLVGKANDYAFPSDHAVVAGALVMSVLLVVRRAGPGVQGAGPQSPPSIPAGRRGLTPSLTALAALAAVLGLLLCFARVYVGAHYPGDVVGGLLLGIVVVLVVSAARPAVYRLAEAVAGTPFGLLVRRPAPALPGAGAGARQG
jgi:undecaprenyl-diphosphatase